MSNHKLKLLVVSLAIPAMFLSAGANATCHKGIYKHHHHYYSCEYTRGMPLVNRVVDRLRADPATLNQPIYVSARGHKVMLSGYVGSSMQRDTAINVTRYTCGVGRVIDEMRLSE